MIRKQLINELKIRKQQIIEQLQAIKTIIFMENRRSIPEPMKFDGPEYSPELDQVRLTGQIKRIYNTMIDGRWRTLSEIAIETHDPEASISAQLRHLRKPRFGSHLVDKRRRGDEKRGLYEYKLIPNNLPIQQKLF